MLSLQQEQGLVAYLLKAVNFFKRSLYNVGSIYSDLFSTNSNQSSTKGQRIEFKSNGIYGYDNFGNLLFFYSNDVTNTDPSNAMLTLGSGLFINLIRNLTGNSLQLVTKDGAAILSVKETNNGSITFTGTNILFTFDETSGFTMATNGHGLIVQNGQINLDTTRGIFALGTAVRLFDNGAGVKFIGFYTGTALQGYLGTLSGGTPTLNLTVADLQLNNAQQNITTETLQKFVLMKDSSGTTIKVAVVA